MHGEARPDGGRDTPTVFNSGRNDSQFWDGRARTLEAQIDGPLLAADEMASSWGAVERLTRSDPAYVAAFEAAYGRPADRDAVRDAIATFERSLVLTGSRFDRFLGGDRAVLSDDEARGYEAFKTYGCDACHQGANVGGNMFQQIAVYGEGPETIGGRFMVTGDPADRGVLRVPSLRLVSRTAPYFHDGSVETLEEAVEQMALDQLGRSIALEDRDGIVAFLGTLSDGAEVLR
jgi:cytochrome c peroxidase